MNKGFVILANDKQTRIAATTCAYSIKNSNKDAQVSLIVPKLSVVEKAIEEPFDAIIELPFSISDIRRANDWQLYWATPYDYTIAVDAFMLINKDMTSAWDYLIDNYELCFSSHPMNFKQESRHLLSDAYEYHNLRYANSCMFYFAKDADLALRHFKLADPFMQNWREVFSQGLKPEYVPLKYDADLMHSMIVQSTGDGEYVVPSDVDVLRLIDMRTSNREFSRKIESSWTEYLNVWLSKNIKIKIQNFAITDPLYYEDPTFLTEEIYNGYRDYFRLTRKQESLVG